MNVFNAFEPYYIKKIIIKTCKIFKKKEKKLNFQVIFFILKTSNFAE